MIEWCNNNAGFLTAIGVIATLLGAVATSVVAVLIARWPYRASLDYNPFLDANPEDAQKDEPYTCPLHLYLRNTGKVLLKIRKITVTNGKFEICGHYCKSQREKIDPLSTKEFVFDVRVPATHLAKKMRIVVKTQRKTFVFKDIWAVG